jgi:hypothetical protein
LLLTLLLSAADVEDRLMSMLVVTFFLPVKDEDLLNSSSSERRGCCSWIRVVRSDWALFFRYGLGVFDKGNL